VAIEAKGKQHVTDRDLSGLRTFAEDFPASKRIVVCAEPQARITEDGILIWPLLHFARELQEGRI
jgi:hypothetical protein